MEKDRDILAFIKDHPSLSSKEIFEGLNGSMSYATLKRRLSGLLDKQYIVQQGNAKNSRYIISSAYSLFYPVDLDSYYRKEIDERDIMSGYNFALIPDVLSKVSLFTKEETEELNALQAKFTQNSSQLTPTEYQKEMERLGIDLSWKSSQIEGNTYSLLETERLLKDKQTAAGKTKEEAIMLLNHKDALDFIVQNPDYLNLLTISGIEDIHSILVKELGVDRNILMINIPGFVLFPDFNLFSIPTLPNRSVLKRQRIRSGLSALFYGLRTYLLFIIIWYIRM